MSEHVTVNLTQPKEEITVRLTANGENVVFSFSEAARGLPGSDADVTNANVNAAIDDDPAATRTSLELGSAALADTGDFAPALGADDNYVTDAQLTVIQNTSGTNTGDQDLSGLQAKSVVQNASFTAITDSVNVVVATATATDPVTPVEGKGFIVIVRNGTATVGGAAYSVAGTIIRRIYHSGAYVNYVYFDSTYEELRGEDFGIVPTTSTDAVAEANATALATAYAASVSTGKPLILKGTIYVKGQVFLSGIYGKIIGYGCTIIQKDTAHNGLTLAADSGVPPFGIIIQGIKIQGQGAATHNAAGIHLRKADLSYVSSDINLIDVQITAFRKGCDIAGVAKFRTENLSITAVRNGCVFNHLQTSLMTNTRINQGDSNAASSCFEIERGDMFAMKVLMGEFGGSGIARFANIAGTSVMLHVESANLEAFTSNQIVNSLVGAHISLIDCRFSQSFTSTQAIISSQVNSGTDVCRVRLENATQFSGTPRFVEVYGTHSATAGVFNMGDERFDATFAATQGGAAEKTVSIFPSVRNFTLTTAFPVSGAIAGDKINYSPLTATDTDGWATNYLFRYRNNHTGSNEWTSLNNNMLMRVLGVSGRTASGNNVETDIQNVTLPIGALRNNGESVEIELFGSTAANANNKQFRFYFGGSQYFDFGLIAINNQSWTLKIKIQRGSFAGGTGFMKLVGVLDYGTGRVIRTAETPNGTIDSTATIATRTTVLTPSAASDAVSLAAKTIWHRAVTTI
jgi:hypothetical protein